MPIIQLPGGKYRYGKSGKIYSGKNARDKARKQGQAIEISKRTEAEIRPSKRSRGHLRRL